MGCETHFLRCSYWGFKTSSLSCYTLKASDYETTQPSGPPKPLDHELKITLTKLEFWALPKKKLGFPGTTFVPWQFVDFVDLFFLNRHVTWFCLSSSFDFNAKKNRYMICVTSKQKMSPAEFWGWFTSITCGENWSFQTWMDVCIVFFVSLFFFQAMLDLWMVCLYAHTYIHTYIHPYIHIYVPEYAYVSIYVRIFNTDINITHIQFLIFHI